MASPAQTLANQQNAQLSTGPVTPEGKQQSSRNAIRHGLTGQTVVLAGEDTEAYTAFRAEVWKDMAPSGAEESILVQTVADTQWRLERARVMESNLVALAKYQDVPADIAQIADPGERQAMIEANGYLKNQKIIHNLQIQEGRLQRTLFKSLKDLRDLQTARRDAVQALLTEAVTLRDMCEKKGLEFNKADLGFLFTEDELDREVIRCQANQNSLRPAVPARGR